MANPIQIRQMAGNDIEMVYQVFIQHSIRKPRDYVTKCWKENENSERITLLGSTTATSQEVYIFLQNHLIRILLNRGYRK